MRRVYVHVSHSYIGFAVVVLVGGVSGNSRISYYEEHHEESARQPVVTKPDTFLLFLVVVMSISTWAHRPESIFSLKSRHKKTCRGKLSAIP